MSNTTTIKVTATGVLPHCVHIKP